MPMTDTFAGRLRHYRQAAGLSRKELAERAGCHEQTVRAWEQGEREPRLSSLVALCAALDVNPAKLIGFRRARPAVAPQLDWRIVTGGMSSLPEQQQPGPRSLAVEDGRVTSEAGLPDGWTVLDGLFDFAAGYSGEQGQAVHVRWEYWEGYRMDNGTWQFISRRAPAAIRLGSPVVPEGWLKLLPPGLREGDPRLLPADYEEPLDPTEPQPSDRDLELFFTAMELDRQAAERGEQQEEATGPDAA
jgi:transcriptional regulator with XRE-family HTH domain